MLLLFQDGTWLCYFTMELASTFAPPRNRLSAKRSTLNVNPVMFVLKCKCIFVYPCDALKKEGGMKPMLGKCQDKASSVALGVQARYNFMLGFATSMSRFCKEKGGFDYKGVILFGI
ncbi:hypothetical protein ACSQ67_003233 [Phaseolus vulgaris]